MVSHMRARLVRFSVCCSGRNRLEVPTLMTCGVAALSQTGRSQTEPPHSRAAKLPAAGHPQAGR
jgi:hypothetical protein